MTITLHMYYVSIAFVVCLIWWMLCFISLEGYKLMDSPAYITSMVLSFITGFILLVAGIFYTLPV